MSKNKLMRGSLNTSAANQYIEQFSQPQLIAMTYLFMLLLGLCDYFTGYDISFAVFYLVPVSFLAWYTSFRAATLSSVISSLTWTAANYLAGEKYDYLAIHIWNTGTRLIFFYVVAVLISHIKLSLETERVLSRSDYLTKILNRRAFYEAAALEMKRAHRYHRPLTVAYIDLDNFKAVNDDRGHDTGDALLGVVALAMQDTLRATDVVARVGGDEFVVLLPETDEKAAPVAIQKMQQCLLEEMQSNQWPVTFSIGVLTCKVIPASVDEMLRRADSLMYEVKQDSKNSINHQVVEGEWLRES